MDDPPRPVDRAPSALLEEMIRRPLELVMPLRVVLPPDPIVLRRQGAREELRWIVVAALRLGVNVLRVGERALLQSPQRYLAELGRCVSCLKDRPRGRDHVFLGD